MPTITFITELVDAARKDGEHTALTVAINAVDLLLDHSGTLEEFREKWGHAKAMYEEHRQ